MSFADLHIHSIASDGSYTPDEIARRARCSGVTLLSVCDHNTVESNTAMARAAADNALAYIPGCEIDSIFEDTDVHVLCYGADFDEPCLAACIRDTREKLDDMSYALLDRMRADYPVLSREAYDAFERDPSQGGWKMLGYLTAAGVTKTLREAFPLYDRYGVTYPGAGFSPLEEVIARIHGAGGHAVLAHPGVTFPCESISALRARIEAVLPLGFDGIECHYPRHTAGIVRLCGDICRERELMTTAGSDCHGAFNHNEIGMTRTPVDSLKLKGLKII